MTDAPSHSIAAARPRSARKRVVSGMRPTGHLHLGHLVGALANWVPLQEQYDCFYFVADWHALTSDFADTSQIVTYAYENVADWIGAGLDPERSTFFVQSLVPEHAELYVLLSMVVPVPWLERVPTYKEQQEALKDKDLSSIGFLGYPLLQTADVAMYDARVVPVGEDQVAHLELAREVVRTSEGQIFSGNIKQDTPDEMVLTLAADKEIRLARAAVEELLPGKVSIMPAGLDKQLSLQELADLVEFLRNCK